MTQKQIDKLKDELNYKYYGDEVRVPANLKKKITKDDQRLYDELSCREMINSILIYGGSCSEGSYDYNEYVRPYAEGDSWHTRPLGSDRVMELISEQREDVSKAEIGFAGCDSEGGSYNYCRFADEI